MESYRLDDARDRLRALASAMKTWTPLTRVAPESDGFGPTRSSYIASTLSAGLELVREGELDVRQLAPFYRDLSPVSGSRRMIAMDEAMRMVEALLFAAVEPLSDGDLAERLPAGVDIPAALANLADHYAGRGVQLARIGSRWRFQTAPDLAFLMTREREEPRKLSRAAQETLAIIAYHQPVTRAEIESIRGVQASAGTLDVLLELKFIRMRGRRRTPGRPVTWGTTDTFLEHYGLAGLSDLPGVAEMRAAGLLSLDLPPDFNVPDPSATATDEEPLEDGEAAAFHLDFLATDDRSSPEDDGAS